MKNQTPPTPRSESGTQTSKLQGLLRGLLGPVIVGLVVLAGQIFVNPIVAKRVRIQESIAQKRYEACERAIELLQRHLASVAITGKPIPEWYKPPEKPPTQLEINVAYTLLAVYGKTQTIAREFFDATDPGKTAPGDIVKFISGVRKEFGVDEKGFVGEFEYRLLRPADGKGKDSTDATGHKIP